MTNKRIDTRTKADTDFASAHCICQMLIHLHIINDQEYAELCKGISKRGFEWL